MEVNAKMSKSVSNIKKPETTASQEYSKKNRLQKIKYHIKRMDWFLFIPYIALCILGVIMVYSASSYRLMLQDSPMFHSAGMQIIYLMISLIIIFGTMNVKLSFIKSKTVVNMLYLLAIFLLIIVLFIGKEVNGAKGWLSLGFMQLQPVEVYKLSLILMTAHFFEIRERLDFGSRCLFYLSVIFSLGLIFIQPDTGGVALVSFIFLSMIACSGIPVQNTWKFVLVLFLLVVIAVTILLVFFPDNYRVSRFTAMAHPFKDIRGEGHQLINSYYAMSNGGWFGVGLGKSIEKRGFLPEAQTDFIFSIIVEELGMLVGLAVLATLCFIILRILYIGYLSPSKSSRLICVGVAAFIFIQMFLNIGGAIGFIPLTGVTLPFISQGGSSLIVLSAALGIVMKISASEYDDRKQIPKRKVKIFE